MRKGIAIAGTIAVDELKKIESYPGRSELTTIKSVSRSNGGAVSNCGITLAKIDSKLPIELIALLGEDEKGDYLKARLEEYNNIDLTQMKIIGDTPFTDVIQDELDHSRTFFTYRGNSVLFTEDTLDLEKISSEILHLAYILLLDSLDQEDKDEGTKMAKILKHAQELGMKTSIDIVSENSNRYEKLVPPSLKYTNYCVINELEAGKTVGIDLREKSGTLKTKSIKEVLVKLKGFGVKDWIVIHSPESSFGYDGEEFFSIPSLQINSHLIKGTVGAGDAYVSGVLYGSLKGLGLKGAMELGTSAAASSLMGEDSTSGVRSYEKLIEMFNELPKQKKIYI